MQSWGCTGPWWTGPLRGGAGGLASRGSALRVGSGAMAGAGELVAAVLRGTTGRDVCTGA